MFSSLFFEKVGLENDFAFNITQVENVIPSDFILVTLSII